MAEANALAANAAPSATSLDVPAIAMQPSAVSAVPMPAPAVSAPVIAQSTVTAAIPPPIQPKDELDSQDAPIKKGKHRRPRIRWSPQLHDAFEKAVLKLGVKSAQPRYIQAEMEAMGVEGLSRESIASHLQKFRQNIVQMHGLSNTEQLTDQHGAVLGGTVPAATTHTAPVPERASFQTAEVDGWLRSRLGKIKEPNAVVRDPDRDERS
ncbi:Myb-like DNA-binding domain [Carpediemonas membranifera]|uniref:Myb-like DNA-binding domain n=1 Tax=Carpediemonas membranifera TaxID=201153 RepID=A0A8J6E2B0_9EUKA|nr:Myb-like DNA-binding domain [Carpediemonas membranifera]|eukprot:KAG9397389.1 Myb-like DNA-binding domain [Carpediemonas membranifera]